MTVSEAIDVLRTYERQGHGAVEIIGMTEVDGRFAIDEDRIFDLVFLPHGSCPKETLVCAFMEKIDYEPAPQPPPRGLRLVA